MERFLAEVLGTGALILLGDGVVAGVLLARSKAQNSGWIVITMGWGIAVFAGVIIAGPVSGAHLNPAVTIGLAVAGATPWDQVPLYLAGEFLGAFLGAVLVYLHYLPHWGITDDADLKLAVYSTGPAVRNVTWNLVSEIIGTFVLVFVVLTFGAGANKAGLAALGPLSVALLVVGIGLSLGGTTGYAINPARDLGPRVAHFLLPIPGKRDSDWEYSWIPVVGPVIGGILAAVIYQLTFVMRGPAGSHLAARPEAEPRHGRPPGGLHLRPHRAAQRLAPTGGVGGEREAACHRPVAAAGRR